MAQEQVWVPHFEAGEATGGVVEHGTAGSLAAAEAAPTFSVLSGNGSLAAVEQPPAVSLIPEAEHVVRAYERFGKPILDTLIAAVVLIVALPLMATIMALLWVTMGSPVLYRQPRVGRNGTTFTIYKFRTMLADRRSGLPSTYDGPERRQSHKTRNDPRVTPIGRFLRKWSLDELPQFWNVLRGDMSLVGPRPEMTSIVARYEPWQHERHVVRPGLTGLWQVSSRANGKMHEHVDIDIEYVSEVSLRNDLRILLRTVPAVLGRSHGF